MQPIREIQELDKAILEDITKLGEPVKIKGLVNKWPSINSAKESDQSIVRYCKKFDHSQLVDILIIPPEYEGEVFYNSEMSGFNFEHRKAPLTALLDQILLTDNKNYLAAQSAPIPECLPGFEKENHLQALAENVTPRIWIGNKITVPTHYDDSHNLACVVSGKRRFTLFPPEQIHNLYIGPLDFAPTGAAISMVNLRKPDLAKYPKFQTALDVAQFADLEPGDAIYIPPLWWHHVESLCNFNILVNYWWGGSIALDSKIKSPYDCLLHGLLNIKHLPYAQRKAWKEFFDYYVFRLDGNNHKHIPENRLGVLGELKESKKHNIRKWLISQLKD